MVFGVQMKRVFLCSFLVLSMLGVGGCASVYEPKPSSTSLVSEQIISSTPSLRHLLISKENSKLIYCSEPSPDATFSQEESMNFSFVSNTTGNDSSGESEGSGEGEMEGRTPAVMMTRELMYRLCEFSRNNKLSKEEAISLYRENLSIIKAIAEIQASKTNISSTESLNKSVSSPEGVPLSVSNAQ